MTKKILSVILAMLMVFSASAFSFISMSAEAMDETSALTPTVSDSLKQLPEVKEGCNRYFFLMPDDWNNEYSDGAGIYWWEGSETPDEWPGYIAHKADADNVYYYDVPKDVETIIWNNNVDCGTDKEAPIYKAAFQTYNITANYYEPLESDTYPQGIPTFDGMIFVTNGYLNAGYYNGRLIYDGEWYYYYGNGEYGLTPGKDDESYMVGDTDSDGVVTVRDATAIQKKIADIPVSNYSELSGDADLNGIVNIKDATEIQKYVARLISVNPFVGATLVIE